ncbi:MAG: DsrE family protein, partial [Candidatus Eremiobacterota bacterium]
MTRITFVLSRSPRDMPGARTVYHLALGALEQGCQVSIFCRNDGVYQPLREQQPTDGQLGS